MGSGEGPIREGRRLVRSGVVGKGLPERVDDLVRLGRNGGLLRTYHWNALLSPYACITTIVCLFFYHFTMDVRLEWVVLGFLHTQFVLAENFNTC